MYIAIYAGITLVLLLLLAIYILCIDEKKLSVPFRWRHFPGLMLSDIIAKIKNSMEIKE